MKDRIKKLRLLKNWTQSDLSEKTGIHLNRVKKLETGRSALTGAEILNFIRFGVNPYWLLTGEGGVFADSPAERPEGTTDFTLLKLVIIAVEKETARRGMKMRPEAKAEAVLTFYKSFDPDFGDIKDEATSERYVFKSVAAAFKLKYGDVRDLPD